MKYKIYIFGKAGKEENELLIKQRFDLLDDAIEGLKTLIPHQISRKDIEMIIIKKAED